MVLTERFIQHAISCPKRISKLLCDLGKTGWEFKPGAKDVINQEVSFEGGRIDVLATFNGRSRAVVAEVKLGTAGPDELEQLKGYLKAWEALPIGPKHRADVVQGFLVAQEFADIPANCGSDEPSWALVQFALERPNVPFSLVTGQTVKQLEGDPPEREPKTSELYSVDETHVNYITDPTVKNLFNDVAHCFLNYDDQHLVLNPKGAHLAVYYKGHDAIVLWARKKFFYTSYWLPGEKVNKVRKWTGCTTDEKELKEDIGKVLKEIDVRTCHIPDGFWSAV